MTRGFTAERLAIIAVLALATAAGIVSALGVVRPPSALCITPYGTASAGPGCDPGQVSAVLGAVAGALTAAVTAVFGFAVAGAVLSVHAHRAGHRRSAETNPTNG